MRTLWGHHMELGKLSEPRIYTKSALKNSYQQSASIWYAVYGYLAKFFDCGCKIWIMVPHSITRVIWYFHFKSGGANFTVRNNHYFYYYWYIIANHQLLFEVFFWCSDVISHIKCLYTEILIIIIALLCQHLESTVNNKLFNGATIIMDICHDYMLEWY